MINPSSQKAQPRQTAMPTVVYPEPEDMHPLRLLPSTYSQCPPQGCCWQLLIAEFGLAEDGEVLPIQAADEDVDLPTPCASCVGKVWMPQTEISARHSGFAKLTSRLELRYQDFVSDFRHLLVRATAAALRSVLGTLQHSEKETLVVSLELQDASLPAIIPLGKAVRDDR
jgi:hypothetical protein